MKKKVIVIHTKYTNFGGEDANIIEEVNLLKNNYEVKYLEFQNTKILNIFDFISFFNGKNYRSNKQLKKVIKEFQPEVAYVHNTWFKASLGIFEILEKNKIQTILKIHNFRYDCTKSFLASSHIENYDFCPRCGFKKKKYQFLNKYFTNSYLKSVFILLYGKRYFKFLLSTKNTIVVLNKFHKDYLNKLGVNNVEVLHNPIKIDENIRVNNIKDSKTLVYAGQLTPEKGIYELFESWDKFENKEFELVIIGAKKSLNSKMLKSFELKNVTFLDELNNSETLKIISKARAVVTATRMYEGQPRLLSEALSMGIPTIYPYFGGMKEYFPDDYKLSFTQYNYDDLITKMYLLFDDKFVESERKKILAYFKKNFEIDLILKKFNDLIK